jgi:hypothetical protein
VQRRFEQLLVIAKAAGFSWETRKGAFAAESRCSGDVVQIRIGPRLRDLYAPATEDRLHGAAGLDWQMSKQTRD